MALPKGFKFSGIKAGIKKDKFDLGVMFSEVPAVAAGMFTKNSAKAAPVLVSMDNIAAPKHRAVVVNSGGANAATGKQGMKDALESVAITAGELGVTERQVLVCCTGVIAQLLPMEKMRAGIPAAVKGLGRSAANFTKAILTTDTGPKQASGKVKLPGGEASIWGCIKGAGMIHPNMATMLCFLATDAAMTKGTLNLALREAVNMTLNRSTVDGDTSTNDTTLIFANGLAGNRPLVKGSAGYKKFVAELTKVLASLTEQMVSGGEGVRRIAEITVEKASNDAEGLQVARSVAGSLLVKTALHGGDANWGRIMMAAGNAGYELDESRISLWFGKTQACRNGKPLPGMDAKLTKEMNRKRVHMRLSLGRGKGKASYLFSDLSKEYVSINADYRT